MKRILAAFLAFSLALFSPAAFPAACCSALTIFPATSSDFSSSILLPPAYTDAIVLVANASQTQAVPTSARWVIFSATCNFYAATGGTAAVPGATTTTGGAAMLNPAAWNVVGFTQITVVSAAACIVTMSFYL